MKTVSKSLASDVVCAIVALLAKGLNLSNVYPSLEKLEFPDGRMEMINLSPKDKCYIDYAHTPEALDTALRDLKEAYPESNIWCLFGCGGDRDKAKRPLMGRVAETIADNVVITNDNPRNENEMDIINQYSFGTAGDNRINTVKSKCSEDISMKELASLFVDDVIQDMAKDGHIFENSKKIEKKIRTNFGAILYKKTKKD